jgi:hypothetical protein
VIEEGECRTCGCALLWVPHETTGRLMPIEREPHATGHLLIDQKTGTYRIVSSVVGDKRTMHRSHFESCPHGRMHRRRARAE